MKMRVNFMEQSPQLGNKLFALGQEVKASSLEKKLFRLATIRASQINGCTFCVDLHVKEAKKISDLSFAIGVINVWNRLSVGFRSVHGQLDEAMGLKKAGLE